MLSKTTAETPAQRRYRGRLRARRGKALAQDLHDSLDLQALVVDLFQEQGHLFADFISFPVTPVNPVERGSSFLRALCASAVRSV